MKVKSLFVSISFGATAIVSATASNNHEEEEQQQSKLVRARRIAVHNVPYKFEEDPLPEVEPIVFALTDVPVSAAPVSAAPSTAIPTLIPTVASTISSPTIVPSVALVKEEDEKMWESHFGITTTEDEHEDEASSWLSEFAASGYSASMSMPPSKKQMMMTMTTIFPLPAPTEPLPATRRPAYKIPGLTKRPTMMNRTPSPVLPPSTKRPATPTPVLPPSDVEVPVTKRPSYVEVPGTKRPSYSEEETLAPARAPRPNRKSHKGTTKAPALPPAFSHKQTPTRAPSDVELPATKRPSYVTETPPPVLAPSDVGLPGTKRPSYVTETPPPVRAPSDVGPPGTKRPSYVTETPPPVRAPSDVGLPGTKRPSYVTETPPPVLPPSASQKTPTILAPSAKRMRSRRPSRSRPNVAPSVKASVLAPSAKAAPTDRSLKEQK
ncbi:hypothetical protein MPSEU_000766200 [Mayamaea pseudoterrestris]|nr:hypothetical protein MPSEU_000766200 [Mayamaea pseudoterrestris]